MHFRPEYKHEITAVMWAPTTLELCYHRSLMSWLGVPDSRIPWPAIRPWIWTPFEACERTALAECYLHELIARVKMSAA